MTRYLSWLLFISAALGAVYAQEPVQELAGDWRGQIELPGKPLEVGLTFSIRAPIGGLTGTIDIPAQSVSELPLTNIQQNGRTVSFGLAGIPGDPQFEGQLSGAGATTRLAGTFSQSGQTFPFTLFPSLLESAARPQEPQPPFPYRGEEITVKRGAIKLAGTLTLPQGDGPFAAVQLITGSGPQDRDETVAGHKPFLLLSDTLTRAGYAVLRFDDRGVGASTGDLAEATYDDLTRDVLAGVAYLEGRNDIDPGGIGLLGHSEGGYLAPLAASRSPDVAFVILLAAPAVSGEAVLALQNRLLYESAGAPEDQIEAQVNYIRELGRLLSQENYKAARALSRQRSEAQLRALPKAQRLSPAEQEAAIEAQLSALTPGFRDFIGYNPEAALAALSVPVLALYGGKDLQVPARQSAPAIKALLAKNPDATVKVFSGLNHLMQPAQTGAPSEYAQIATTMSLEVLETITGWLAARF